MEEFATYRNPQRQILINFYSNFLKAVDTNFSSSEVKENKLEEPVNIEGPVNFIYLKGDPGDGVQRKVLLLGDIHSPEIAYPPNSSINIANFCRYVSQRTPQIIDIFIESFYEGPQPSFSLPQEEEQGKYLSNLIFTFRNCLRRNKSLCDEPMRIHYIDTRYLIKGIELFSLFLIESFLRNVLDPVNIFETGLWDLIIWPYDNEIENIARLTIEDARLTDIKLLSIDSSIRQKFKDIIITPIIQKITAFYRDTSHRDLFEQAKQIRQKAIETKTEISIQEYVIVSELKTRIIILKSDLLDAYFVYRLLKRATNRKAELPKIALKPGEPTTHVIGYMGAAHTFGIRDMLYKLGFNILGKEDASNIEITDKNKQLRENVVQCLSYDSIRKSVDDFCTEKSLSKNMENLEI